MTSSGWMIRRVAPFVGIVGAAAVTGGVVRGLGLFLPGIAGMVAGCATGWLAGRLTRNDLEERDGFGLRAGLATGAAVLWAALGAATVSLLATRDGEGPLHWLSGVLRGSRGELFFGFSRGSFQGISGRLEGGWWLGFVALDALLFAALFLVSFGTGVSPDEDGTIEDDDGGEEPPKAELAEPPPLPVAPAIGPGGVAVFAVFLAVSLAALVVPQGLWSARTGPARGPAARAVAAEMRGLWIFGPGASFLGSGEDCRTFRLVSGTGGELAGVSVPPGRFLLSLEPRRDGSYSGGLVVPATVAFDLRMLPSEGGGELRFVFSRPGGAGLSRFEVIARRLPTVGE